MADSDVTDPGMAQVEATIAWRDWATHQEWCGTCAEDAACFDGSELRRRAVEIDALLDARAAEVQRVRQRPVVEAARVRFELRPARILSQCSGRQQDPSPDTP